MLWDLKRDQIKLWAVTGALPLAGPTPPSSQLVCSSQVPRLWCAGVCTSFSVLHSLAPPSLVAMTFEGKCFKSGGELCIWNESENPKNLSSSSTFHQEEKKNARQTNLRNGPLPFFFLRRRNKVTIRGECVGAFPPFFLSECGREGGWEGARLCALGWRVVASPR